MLATLVALTLTAAPVQEPAEVAAPPPAAAEIAEALTRAAAKNQRVLLMWGGDW